MGNIISRDITEILASASYHARELLSLLESIDPEIADEIPTNIDALCLAETLTEINEHPAIVCLP